MRSCLTRQEAGSSQGEDADPGAHALQVKVLSARFLRTWWRSPVNLVVQAAQYLFFAFLIGARQQRMPICIGL
jgi:hypothetical protein